MPPEDRPAVGESLAAFEALFKRATQTDPDDVSVDNIAVALDGEPSQTTPSPPEAEPEPKPETTNRPSQSKPHFHDHRNRLRDKFARRGGDAFDDYELLELILFQVLPRIDTKPIAKALIKQFGSLADVVAAPVEKLVEVKGIGASSAQHMKLLHQVSVRINRSAVINRPVLSSWNALLDYCRSAMQFEGREQFRVLFLDKKNRLLGDEIMGQGTVDRAPVYPREIVRRALVHDATAVILAHNHPSGDPTPSRQDIELTQRIVETLKAINVIVHDHLVIGREDVASFKMLGLM